MKIETQQEQILAQNLENIKENKKIYEDLIKNYSNVVVDTDKKILKVLKDLKTIFKPNFCNIFRS